MWVGKQSFFFNTDTLMWATTDREKINNKIKRKKDNLFHSRMHKMEEEQI